MWSFSTFFFLSVFLFLGVRAADFNPCKSGGCPKDRCTTDTKPITSFRACVNQTCRCLDSEKEGLGPKHLETKEECKKVTDKGNACYKACKDAESALSTYSAHQCADDKSKLCYCKASPDFTPRCKSNDDCKGFCFDDSKSKCVPLLRGVCTCNRPKSKAGCVDDPYCELICRALRTADDDLTKNVYTFGRYCSNHNPEYPKKACICFNKEPDA